MRLDPRFVLFVCLLFIYCDVKMNTATCPSVGCMGGSRYVEGCWGFPYLKIKIQGVCVGFVVCWFLDLKMFYVSKDYLYLYICHFPFSVLLFLIDVLFS